ncbi:uncharacterized protein [Melopsittacus undulatus]|uniref:uncharacterized protein n=1 Tax=Melopsittacus undulatus TaxID=13146 RepID=UPI00146BCD03|nr:uncharacterized protein LOC117436151 [Melopsittacus undulatus]
MVEGEALDSPGEEAFMRTAGDGQGKKLRRWRRRFQTPEPCTSVSPVCGPWCSTPGCTDCIKAALELQELVLSAWAGKGAAAELDDCTWRALWQDLKELVEQEQLRCCDSPSYTESISPPESLTATVLTRDGGAPMKGDGQGKKLRRWRRRFQTPEPCTSVSPVCGPWCSTPGCTDCIKAALELQELVLSEWAGKGAAAELDDCTWQALWQDLKELVEQEQLRCCDSPSYTESISPPESLTATVLTRDGGAPMKGDGQGKKLRRWRRRFQTPEPCTSVSPVCGPWCSTPGCTDCIKAALELQELVLSEWAGKGAAAELDDCTWQALWQDLKELVEQEQLRCCDSPSYTESISPPESLTATVLTRDGGAPMKGDGQGKKLRRWRRRFQTPEPCTSVSPVCGPWCSTPGCTDCIKAALELQELVLSEWAGKGAAAELDDCTWQALWQDLKELVEQEQLRCCDSPSYTESISPPESLTATVLTRDGGAPMKGDGQGKKLRRWRRRFQTPEPCTSVSPVCGPWCSTPGCTDCIKAALELQELVLSEWAGKGAAAELDDCTWQALWQDLKELVEQEQLRCCDSPSYTESISPPESLTATVLTRDGGAPMKGDGQGKKLRRWRRRFQTPEPCTSVSPVCGPWCSTPGCTDCIKAALELQELVLSEWAGKGAAAELDDCTWQALWQDLKELVEQEQLRCCDSPSYTESISPPESLTATVLTRDGGAPMKGDGQGKKLRRWRRRFQTSEPCKSPAEWAGKGAAAELDDCTWQALWQDLKELVEQEQLRCCDSPSYTESISPPESLTATVLTRDGGAPMKGDGQGKKLRRWRRRFQTSEPCTSVSPVCGPWRCTSGCTDCIKAALELQELVLSAWAGKGAAAELDDCTWQALWQDLKELVEQEQLRCCDSPRYTKSIRPPESLTATVLTRDGGAPMEMKAACFLQDTGAGRVSSALKIHVAGKALEIRLGALPMLVKKSQEQAAQQQGCLRVLPKLTLPGQSQRMLQHELYPSMQAKANAIVDPIEEEEVRSLCGFSIPTEKSLTPDSQKKPAIQAPEEDTLRKSLLHLGRGLSPWEKVSLWRFGLDTAPTAIPSLDNGAAGPEEGPASMLLRKDADCQLNVPTQGRVHAQAEDRSWCCDTAPSRNIRLELNRKVHSKLWIHTARKCLEIKLEILPMAVQRSMDMLQGPVPGLSGLRQAGTGHLRPRKGSAPVAKAKQLRQKEWVPQQQVQASLTCTMVPMTPCSCTMVPMTPCSCLDSISSNSPVLGQERSSASLEAWTLHSTSFSSGNEMDTDPKDAQKTLCGIVKDSIRVLMPTMPSPGCPGHCSSIDQQYPACGSGEDSAAAKEGVLIPRELFHWMLLLP